jgi:hypothetical protein
VAEFFFLSRCRSLSAEGSPAHSLESLDGDHGGGFAECQVVEKFEQVEG